MKDQVHHHRPTRRILLARALLCSGLLGIHGWAEEGRWIPPDVSLGWLEDARKGEWALHRQTSTSVAGWRRSGWWLQARTGLRFGAGRDLLLEGGWLLPRSSSGVWKADPGPTGIAFDVPSYRWGTVDGLFRQSLAQGQVHLLGGVRWDRKKTRVHYADATDDVYRLTTFAPLLGVEAVRPLGGGDLSLRLLGSPFVRGRVGYRYWVDSGGFEEHGAFNLRRGSMLECRAQYLHDVDDRWRLGGFVQWGFQRATSETSALKGGTAERVSWRVTHQAWTVGITAAF